MKGCRQRSSHRWKRSGSADPLRTPIGPYSSVEEVTKDKSKSHQGRPEVRTVTEGETEGGCRTGRGEGPETPPVLGTSRC